jgi:hypothetical protein
MILHDIQVGCHEGHRGRERPAWVVLDGARVEVVEILDRWYEGALPAGGPTLSYFKLRLKGGRVILVRHAANFDRWAMVETSPL